MARQPKPWFWKARGAWYVQIDGKQVKLHEIKKEADREFYRLMASEGKLDQKQAGRMTVADACEAMIASSQYLRPGTVRMYVEKLGAFSDAFGARRIDSVKPPEVIQWAGTVRGRLRNKPIGESTRSTLFRFVKQLYKWCRDTGLIEADPFVRVANPWRVRKRDTAMSDADYEKVLSLSQVSPAFKQVVEFIWRTGIRPGELSVLAARHMDAHLPIARFQPTEHKTGTKTGLQREVYFPADLWERLRSYAETHREGPLVRRANGKPWSAQKISETYSRLKKRHGLAAVLYQARHRYATTMLDGGVPQSRVAKMMGHVNPGVLMSTYYHPEAAQMAADVDASSDAEAERMKQIAAKVTAAREEARAAATESQRMANQRYRMKLKSQNGS